MIASEPQVSEAKTGNHFSGSCLVSGSRAGHISYTFRHCTLSRLGRSSPISGALDERTIGHAT